MSMLLALALAPAVLPVELPAVHDTDPCADLAPRMPDGKPRAVETRDLAELVDIGRSDPNESPSPFGISADGRRIAFMVRRANPRVNGYCQRLLVMPLDAGHAPVELDRGGEFIRDTFILRNFTAIAAGWTKVVTPRWSPDGNQIAFLKRINGSTQVWLVDAAGNGAARRVTAMPDDVEDFAWSGDGTALIVATRPGLRAELAGIASEARSGYLFDDRFAPQFAAQPLPVEPHPLVLVRWMLAAGAVQPAQNGDPERLGAARPRGLPTTARGFAISGSGDIAWTEPREPKQLLSPTRLVMLGKDGAKRICATRDCEGIAHLWWSRDGTSLYALQKTGWGRSQTALLVWRGNATEPRRVFTTEDALIGCALTGGELVCAREGAIRPRRLVRIDPETGRQRLVFDPNPGFAGLRLGQVRRLRFRNAFGVESYADLVLPPDHRPGQRHPLVLVQYNSDGFLRGGTDDEFPIQALAGRGFAVLSFARPDFVPAALMAGSEQAMRSINRKDWIDRRSVQSSLELAINLALASGAVDPDRMGISGFSDGTSTVQWALINSRLFKVAALGACCEDLSAYPLNSGPAFERYGNEMGYRFFQDDAAQLWQPLSLVLNADRIDTPILIQTGDSEYQIGLDVVSAYRARGKPIELIVLDHEGHFKSQPAHRQAIYDRSLDWFDFWLMRRMDCSSGKAVQYIRWKAMKGAPRELACLTPRSSAP